MCCDCVARNECLRVDINVNAIRLHRNVNAIRLHRYSIQAANIVDEKADILIVDHVIYMPFF